VDSGSLHTHAEHGYFNFVWNVKASEANTGPDSSQINNSSFSKMLILFNTIDSASDILNADKASVRKIVNAAMRSSKRKLLYESFLLPSPQA
jgi:hypothetical protein